MTIGQWFAIGFGVAAAGALVLALIRYVLDLFRDANR